MFAIRQHKGLARKQPIIQLGVMVIYHALIECSGPDDVHHRASIEAESLVQAKRLLEEQYGEGKVFSIWGERESNTIR